ncbi:unnamed protein product [Diatraea saccharalis]|uniref:Uncharacterized protein n=1 Tax=Diatraea saccharalis TaxID=40085 RepID=A0A9N9N3I0_9NEOP|nr:unnamed protein product [Diatraea saccharalis]
MTFTLQLIFAVLQGLVGLTTQSITGVTYMDNFDFEERYRNVDECNPFYWHPLHMPEHCTKMFETLIRAGVGAFGPTKIVKDKNYANDQYYESDEEDGTLPPYEKMVQLLKNDISKEPIEPEITFLPGIGPAALYHQPVSKQSADYIKAVAKAYRHISFAFGPLYNPIEVTTCETRTDKDEKNAGLSYMDPLNFRPLPKSEVDPCNPLYWYPRAIPESCYLRTTPRTQMALPPDGVVPLPIPVPVPGNIPLPPLIPPIPSIIPAIPPIVTPVAPIVPPVLQMMPPVPFGLPLAPSHPMLPVPGIPYPPPYQYPPRQAGMVPGIRGIVSEDGGINILPFSDAYSQLLESHKNKILRKRLRKLFDDYNRSPRWRKKKYRNRSSGY